MSEQILTWEELPETLRRTLEYAQISSRQARWGASEKPFLPCLKAPPKLALPAGIVSSEHLEILFSGIDGFQHSAALVAELRSQIGSEAVDRFAADLIRASHAPAKCGDMVWRIFSMAVKMGGPEAARAIVNYYRENLAAFDSWSGPIGFARCLSSISRPELLPILFDAVRELKPSYGRNALKSRIQALAALHRFSEEDLEDFAASTCDLNENGTYVFDYGPRRFFLAIDSDLKPYIADSAGKRQPDLPPIRPEDDQTRANEAQAKWKWLQVRLKDTVKDQRTRLKKAQQNGRRWTPQAFEERLRKHPLLRYLAPRLTWAVFEGEKVHLLEPEAPVPEGALVGIAHAALLTPEQLQECRVRQAAMKGKPLFDQWEGADQSQPQQNADARELAVLSVAAVSAARLLTLLEQSGWERAKPDARKMLSRHTRPFPKLNLTAVVEYPGIPVFFGGEWTEQKLQRCYFIAGLFPPQRPSEAGEPLALTQVDPLALHAVQKDIEAWKKSA